jgi:hypothetical protein
MNAIDRRNFLLAGSAGAALMSEGRAAAGKPSTLRFDDPEFRLRTWLRLTADLGGRVVYTFVGGMVYGFRPQADDLSLADFGRRLYGYRSCVARQVKAEADGSFQVRSRGWFYYCHAETGAFFREFINPYTQLRVQCPPRMGPVATQVYDLQGLRRANGATAAEQTNLGPPYHFDHAVMGRNIWMRQNVFSRFKPADTTWYKLESDILTYTAALTDVRNPRLGHIPNTTSHNLVAEWQTWMNMHGSPGHILFVGNGAHSYRPTNLPPEIQQTVAQEFPGTLQEPLTWT